MDIQLSARLILVHTDMILLADMERIYQKQYPYSPALNRYTVHENESSRKAGILGELVFAELYAAAKWSTDKRYDFLYKGNRIDVKCKLRNVPPDIYTHEASIFDYQSSNNRIDVYYFMSTIPTFETVWLCGYITKKELLAHQFLEHWRRNAVDYSNNKIFKADTLSITYKYLNKVDINKLDIKSRYQF